MKLFDSVVRLSLRRTCGAVLLFVAMGSSCTSCDEAEERCSSAEFPTVGSVPGRVVYVASECNISTFDGSATRPFATIGDASAVAQPGDTIVVAAGTYGEAVVLDGGVGLVGAGADGTVISPVTDEPGIRVSGEGTSSLEGLAVVGATDVGIRIDEADVVLKASRIEGTVGSPGNGVEAEGSARLEIVSSEITSNAGVGVIARNVGQVVILEPDFAPGPGDGGQFILEPDFFPTPTVVSDNGLGGVAILEPDFVPADGHALELTGVDVRGNGDFGVALYGASANIVRSAVRGTLAREGHDFADGLVVAPAVDGAEADGEAPGVVVDETSIVGGNERSGVLVAGAAAVTVEGAISNNELGGLWAQSERAQVAVVEGAVVRDNGMVGVAATAGATLDINGAEVSGTTARTSLLNGSWEDVGDGIAAFRDSRVTVADATVTNNARAGLIVDLAQDLTVHRTTISGSETGIAELSIPAGTYDADPAANGIEFATNDNDTGGAELGYAYQESRCASGAAATDVTSCHPEF